MKRDDAAAVERGSRLNRNSRVRPRTFLNLGESLKTCAVCAQPINTRIVCVGAHETRFILRFIAAAVVVVIIIAAYKPMAARIRTPNIGESTTSRVCKRFSCERVCIFDFFERGEGYITVANEGIARRNYSFESLTRWLFLFILLSLPHSLSLSLIMPNSMTFSFPSRILTLWHYLRIVYLIFFDYKT